MEVQEMVKPICKYAVIIKNVKEVAYQFEKSIAISKSGRMGPVLIEIPDDISRMNMPKKLIRYKPKKKKVNQNKLLISKVKKMLENSKKPIFLVGNGLVQSGALNLFKKFIKKNKIPDGLFMCSGCGLVWDGCAQCPCWMERDVLPYIIHD